jgi:hypothetical protein
VAQAGEGGEGLSWYCTSNLSGVPSAKRGDTKVEVKGVSASSHQVRALAEQAAASVLHSFAHLHRCNPLI